MKIKTVEFKYLNFCIVKFSKKFLKNSTIKLENSYNMSQEYFLSGIFQEKIKINYIWNYKT